MTTFFTSCFLIGVFVTVVSFLVGGLFDLAGMDGLDLDIGGVDIDIPLSPTVYLGFITVFGATGLILLKQTSLGNVFIILIAAAAGMACSMFLYRCVILPLRRAQNTSAAEESELLGLEAYVNERITKGKYGEIRYCIHGNSYTSPAKSCDEDLSFEVNEKVYIRRIEDHVFYVNRTQN